MEEKKERIASALCGDCQKDMYGAILHKVTHTHLQAYCGFCVHRHPAGGCRILSEMRRFTDPACIKFSEKTEQDEN